MSADAGGTALSDERLAMLALVEADHVAHIGQDDAAIVRQPLHATPMKIEQRR